MTGQNVEVRSEVFGGREGRLPPVLLQVFEERVTVEALIRRTVEEQVRELLAQRRLDAGEARRTLDRHYLTAREISEAARQGAVRYPSGKDAKVPDLDPEAEIRKALRAFEEGAYYVLVDGRQMERLDEKVRFAPGTKATFLRVMPLVGG